MYSLSQLQEKSVASPNTSFIVNGYEKLNERLNDKSVSPNQVFLLLYCNIDVFK